LSINSLDRVLLRLAVETDEDFLRRLYTAGRAAELTALGWSDEQVQQFCDMQYRAQNWQHDMTFNGAVDQIVEMEGQPIGRLKVLEAQDKILLVDIALLPNSQNQGIGTKLLENLKTDARMAGKPLRLHVLVTSPGIRLYQRLGFNRIADDGAYIEMEFQPNKSKLVQ
jgi:ribosomal protein S18 acetylase RimI-like enzyme